MIPALWISKTGLDAQQMQINVISNNLANVNTVGFKKGRAVFEDLLYQTIKQPGADSSQTSQLATGLMVGTGVKVTATAKNFSQGSVLQTEGSLDMSISGRGFFQVLTPDGNIAYSRNGEFQVDATGQIVTANGNALQPSITVPQGALSVSVGSDGTVSALVAGNSSVSQLGNIQIADFINPAGLQAIGENLYRETPASGTALAATPGSSGLGTIAQGSLESSNVNVVEELVNLIQAQRAYEMNSKAVGAVDKMLEYVNQVL